MPIYYLVVGNTIKQEIDTDDTDVTVLPILDSARAVSLINRQHITALMSNTGLTTDQVVSKLGLIDERVS